MTKLISLIFLSFIILAGGCSRQEQQQPASAQISAAPDSAAAVYTCPMHPDVTSSEPGSCPKCGMALKPVSGTTEPGTAEFAVEHIKQAKKLIALAKSELTKEGVYRCCIEPACDQCALDHQNCPCMNDLKKGKAVCTECYAGWQRGEGRDKSINPKDVKTSLSGHRH